MKVLLDNHDIDKSGLNKPILTSYYVKRDTEIQQELFNVLSDFDLASLKTYEEVREMLSFTYFSLSENQQWKDIYTFLIPLYKKRLQDFRAGKFSSMSPTTQADLLIRISHQKNRLSEQEIDKLSTELKVLENGAYRAALMYYSNPHRALDFVASKWDGQELMRFSIMHGISNPGIQIRAISYVLKKYDSLLSEDNKRSLNSWLTGVKKKVEKLKNK